MVEGVALALTVSSPPALAVEGAASAAAAAALGSPASSSVLFFTFLFLFLFFFAVAASGLRRTSPLSAMGGAVAEPEVSMLIS